jgi:hypothetical protein
MSGSEKVPTTVGLIATNQVSGSEVLSRSGEIEVSSRLSGSEKHNESPLFSPSETFSASDSMSLNEQTTVTDIPVVPSTGTDGPSEGPLPTSITAAGETPMESASVARFASTRPRPMTESPEQTADDGDNTPRTTALPVPTISVASTGVPQTEEASEVVHSESGGEVVPSESGGAERAKKDDSEPIGLLVGCILLMVLVSVLFAFLMYKERESKGQRI